MYSMFWLLGVRKSEMYTLSSTWLVSTGWYATRCPDKFFLALKRFWRFWWTPNLTRMARGLSMVAVDVAVDGLPSRWDRSRSSADSVTPAALATSRARLPVSSFGSSGTPLMTRQLFLDSASRISRPRSAAVSRSCVETSSDLVAVSSSSRAAIFASRCSRALETAVSIKDCSFWTKSESLKIPLTTSVTFLSPSMSFLSSGALVSREKHCPPPGSNLQWLAHYSCTQQRPHSCPHAWVTREGRTHTSARGGGQTSTDAGMYVHCSYWWIHSDIRARSCSTS